MQLREIDVAGWGRSGGARLVGGCQVIDCYSVRGRRSNCYPIATRTTDLLRKSRTLQLFGIFGLTCANTLLLS